MTMMSGRPLRVGLCGIGLDTYWPQFTGLQKRLEGYMAQVATRIARPGVEVVNLGMVDSVERSRVKTSTFCFSMSLRMHFRIQFYPWCSEPASRWWC
jgi:hypothetical protein